MTIAELIATLQELPQDLPVYVYERDDIDDFPISAVDVEESRPCEAFPANARPKRVVMKGLS